MGSTTETAGSLRNPETRRTPSHGHRVRIYTEKKTLPLDSGSNSKGKFFFSGGGQPNSPYFIYCYSEVQRGGGHQLDSSYPQRSLLAENSFLLFYPLRRLRLDALQGYIVY